MLKIRIAGIEELFLSSEREFKIERENLVLIYSFSNLPDSSGVLLRVSIRNEDPSPKKVGKIDLIEIQDVSEPVYYNNWQSWFPFKAYWERPLVDSFVQYADSQGISLFAASPIPELLRKGQRPSDYFIATDELLVGFVSNQFTHQYFLWDDETLSIIGSVDLFGTELASGESIELEEMVILGNKSLWTMLEKYADLIKQSNEVEFNEFEGIGWCSWYHYFTDITFDELSKNVKLLAEIRDREKIDYRLVQLDDGYEKEIGDWLTTNSKFPDLKEIASEIRGKGFKAGLWIAPFSASESSRLFNEHKEWFVKNSDGNPRVAYRNWNKQIFALDTTNPEVLLHLERLIKTIRSYGFDYLKIDFLFAGAIPGGRFNEFLTPVEAYRSGMQTIRAAAGDDCFILGCGAPLLPSVGYVDGMRIGSDTAPEWNGETMDIGVPSARYSLRNAYTRSFMHRRLWLNDPDTIVLRNCGLTEEEKRVFALSVGLLDGMMLTSDDMSQVGRDGISLLMEAMQLRGGEPRVFLDGMNGVFATCTRNAPVYDVTSFVNLNDTPRHSIKLKKMYQDWSGVIPSVMEVELPPRSIWIEKREAREGLE
ncbi:glycoside hydrolase family 36 protein [Mesotoga sp. B105.6.4]|uniref:glycoside hydrolase family 36 protein n=1 Tax=Mesotoga sp. B105.6.4 TaxID=1582224 RepID=UPI000CCC3561|nr:glycoside hydrolase family 36 protein [Mesotoga sp. B105.6.4]PNS39711.1 glycoside hydrolase [Mesotoga sp. B105.6.4]